MNVIEGLRTVRERLVENEAEPATLAHVDQIIGAPRFRRPPVQRPVAAAADADADAAPDGLVECPVYNDLVMLEEQLETAAVDPERAEAEDAESRSPKPRSTTRNSGKSERRRLVVNDAGVVS